MKINITNYATWTFSDSSSRRAFGIAGDDIMYYILVFLILPPLFNEIRFFVANWHLYLAIMVSANVPAFKVLDHQYARRWLHS